MAKIDKLTPDQEAQIPITRDEWLRHGLSTEPADFESAERAIKDAYAVTGLSAPEIFIRLVSPYEGAIAATILNATRLGQEVKDQVGAQVGDQVGAQVRAQVWAQVRALVRAQVGDQVGDQVRAQVGDQVRAQVWAQVWAQVGDQVWDQVGDQVGALVWAAYCSQHESGWLSFYAYFAKACGLESAKRLDPLMRLAQSSGWVWFFSGAAIITDRPRILRRDNEYRLHCEDGPALEYRDGFSIYAWHGTRIPAEWIEDKASLTPQAALTWGNVDQRAAACEILGWHHIINSLNARVIDEDADPQIGRLVEINLPNHGPQKFIHARCGTGREVAVMADARAETVIEAQAASYGLTADDFFKPEVRT